MVIGNKRKFNRDHDYPKKKTKSCWGCGKWGHLKSDCRIKFAGGNGFDEAGPSESKDPNKVNNETVYGTHMGLMDHSPGNQPTGCVQVGKNPLGCEINGTRSLSLDDMLAWWVDSGATSHVCKDLKWFETFEPIEDGSVLRMGNVATEPIKGIGKVRLVSESDKFILSRHGTFFGFGYLCNDLCNYHDTPSLGNKKYVVTYIDDATRYCYVYLVHAKDEALDKFKVYKQEVELLHGLSDGFWGEAMLTACYLLNRTPNKKNKITPYELWKKKPPNLKVWRCRAVVRLTEPKIKNLGEKGIDCIFIGYAENSKAYRFYVLEPNDSVSVNTVIEFRDAIFDENRFTSIPRPRDVIQNFQGGISNPVEKASDGNGSIDIPNEPRKTRTKKPKSFGSDFHLYLVEGTRNEVEYQYQY
ncbi:uncharacterized protein LOC143589518 [Bidens hawaiensis]|uniref:uncharacterized protein LOC143589518 n=1 Tax=Bidens hawaiensis TaxID=980011 RepID=UPI0040497BE7